MNRLFRFLLVGLGGGITAAALGQGGFGGGGFGAGGGNMGESYDRSVQGIESVISSYLTGEEVKNILTPGEFSEWPITLKAGQVVIAEARSDAFDPALEVVAADGKKVLASNDDRYPGDQRPLLLWRCDQSGSYSLRARCFHDKSGGQFFLRMKIFDSVDSGQDILCKSSRDAQGASLRPSFLIRIPMKAGAIKRIGFGHDGEAGYVTAELRGAISPTGLPDANLGRSLSGILRDVIVAPVDGDYYEIAYANGDDVKIDPIVSDIAPKRLTEQSAASPANAPAGSVAVWELPVKAGDVLRVSIKGARYDSRILVMERPDFAAYDLSKPDSNPFYPKTTKSGDEENPVLTRLPSRALDGRVCVFAASRDAAVWIATAGTGDVGKEYTLTVEPACREFSEGKSFQERLQVGGADYWSFDANAGDVVAIDSSASAFTEECVVRDPKLEVTEKGFENPDESRVKLDVIAQKSGRYLVSISSMGVGGGGDYKLSRKVIHPSEFRVGSPARGDFSDGQVHVWKFSATPERPLLLRWHATGQVMNQVTDDKGQYTLLSLDPVDDQTSYAIVKVTQPMTYMISLYPNDPKAKYELELTELKK
ncbi:MAG TPA: hypothetical protein VMI31_10290 [Fimbriimonadaceae bacterium]|nr:hypothetical protein [Fimbriimonadaceae bacterium]